MPSQEQIQKLIQILESFEDIPAEEKQAWINKLPTLSEELFAKAEKAILEAHEKIQQGRKDFLGKLEEFQKTKMREVFQAEETKERQAETTEMENLLSQME